MYTRLMYGGVVTFGTCGYIMEQCDYVLYFFLAVKSFFLKLYFNIHTLEKMLF